MLTFAEVDPPPMFIAAVSSGLFPGRAPAPSSTRTSRYLANLLCAAPRRREGITRRSRARVIRVADPPRSGLRGEPEARTRVRGEDAIVVVLFPEMVQHELSLPMAAMGFGDPAPAMSGAERGWLEHRTDAADRVPVPPGRDRLPVRPRPGRRMSPTGWTRDHVERLRLVPCARPRVAWYLRTAPADTRAPPPHHLVPQPIDGARV